MSELTTDTFTDALGRSYIAGQLVSPEVLHRYEAAEARAERAEAERDRLRAALSEMKMAWDHYHEQEPETMAAHRAWEVLVLRWNAALAILSNPTATTSEPVEEATDE